MVSDKMMAKTNRQRLRAAGGVSLDSSKMPAEVEMLEKRPHPRQELGKETHLTGFAKIFVQSSTSFN